MIIRIAGIVLILCVACDSAVAQDCSIYNISGVFNEDYANDGNDHISGMHTMTTSNANWSCSYTGTSGPCTVLAQVGVPSPVMTESGVTFSGCHVDGKNTSTPQASGTGAQTVNGAAGGAASACVACLCTVSISFNPFSVSGGSPVWSHQVPLSHTCDGKSVGRGGGGGLPGCCGNPAMCSAHYICNANCQCEFASPILIDTTGHGFHLTSAQDGVVFDFFGDGKPQQLSWTAADSGNGFLALDWNGNGRIDDATELFGNVTAQPPSADPNGYLALAEFDKPENGGNGDGIIDWHDAVYSKLLIWIDVNHDGISQPEELRSLPSMGVYSIGLKYTEERKTDQYGNTFRYRGVLNPNPLDGTSRDGRYTYDVFFVGAASNSAGCRNKQAVDSLKELTTDFLKDDLWLRQKP